MLDKLIFLLALASTAVVYADVLVRPGMLLEPVQRALRNTWTYFQLKKSLALSIKLGKVPPGRYESQLDEQWWWSPLWGCFKCVAGQWGFWGYLIRYHAAYTWRTVPEHLAFTAFTILTAIILHKWTQE